MAPDPASDRIFPGVSALLFVASTAATISLSAIGETILLSIAACLPGTTFPTATMHRPAMARMVPIAAGVIVLLAGAFQFSPFKTPHFACCRTAPRQISEVAVEAESAEPREISTFVDSCDRAIPGLPGKVRAFTFVLQST